MPDNSNPSQKVRKARRGRKRNSPQNHDDGGVDVNEPHHTSTTTDAGAGSDSQTISPDFFNRELQWLEFNRRVLNEAKDSRTPLLERVRFLAIFTSNLDEFVMKRMGSLKRQALLGIRNQKYEGAGPREFIKTLRSKVLPMLADQAEILSKEIMPALAKAGVSILKWDELTVGERDQANKYFRENIFPVLTPLAVDQGHPFPFLSNLSTSLAVTVSHPDRDEKLFARVKIPRVFPRFFQLTTEEFKGQYRFVAQTDIIQHNLGDLFPNMKILSVMPFRITRNANIARDEEDADDLLEMVEEELRQRRFAQIVRLEHGPNPDPWMLRFLTEELDLAEDDVYELPAELDFTDLVQIANLNIPLLKYESWSPAIPPGFLDEENSVFNIMRAGDILVHHPYESFAASVERFIRTAADDPRVIAIKMALYRTGDDSPFIPALIRAAESGKQVVVLIELKARFDEERNINWAQELESTGVHVVYGIVGLKTHAKVALAVRKDSDGLRSYCHIGTGNYHTGTARLYTDFGLFTCRPDIAEDVVELFHYLTGRSLKTQYRKLLVAPVNMKDKFIEKIERETRHKKEGRPAQIIAKMNGFDNPAIGRVLYSASQEGVEIDLIIRGICCVKPRVPGMSERIRVVSIIGRFLEHSRIFYFRNGAENPVDGEFYIGSTDWMDRNLLGRVEAAVPIEDRALRERLWDTFQIMLKDQRQAWDMQPDGTYVQRQPQSDDQQAGTHQQLMKLARRTAPFME